MSEKATTNKEFSKTEAFTNACDKAGVEATKRQASKFRNQKGSAYLARNKK